MKIFPFLSVLIGMTGLMSTPVRSQTETYQNDAVYVRFRQQAAPKTATGSRMVSIEKAKPLQNLQEIYGLHREMACMRTLGSPVLERTFKIYLDSSQKIDLLLEELRNDESIEMVERIPLYYLQGAVAENSPGLPQKEGSDPFYESGSLTSASSWHLNMIHAEDAWSRQTGSDKIKVAVVDNAIWGEHPDLQILPENQYNIAAQATGNSAPPASVNQESECSDANNCVPYNWSHGTHCAGIVGAIRNNGVGIASIGSGVTLMGISCPGTDASGLAVRNAFEGVSYAASHGAKVISISWGNYSVSQTDRAIIQTCIDNNIIVVAAAGNNGYKDRPMYPANLPGVISVTSVNNDKQLSSFSNNGEWVCLAAPGGRIVQNNIESQGCILSTTYCVSQRYRLGGYNLANGQHYDGMFGTSMATPLVSGLCGLLLSADSTIDPYLMREILISTAQPMVATIGKNIAPNSGIVDAGAAIQLKNINIKRVRNLSSERQGFDLILRWEKPESENAVSSYQIFSNNVFVGQVPGDELTFTQKIGNQENLYHFGVRVLYANGDTSLRTGLDVEIPNLYTVDVTVQPEGCGSVVGSGIYPAGDIRLVAKAVEGCSFSRWMEDNKAIGRDTVLDYTVSINTEIRAVFTGTPAVGNSLFERNLFAIYPNPSSGKFTVEMNGEDNLLEIFSVNGSLVARHEHVSGSMEVSLKESGTYIVSVRNASGKGTKKVVIR